MKLSAVSDLFDGLLVYVTRHWHLAPKDKFELIVAALAFIFFLLWLIYLIFFRRRILQDEDFGDSFFGKLLSQSRGYFLVFLVILLVHSSLLEPYHINHNRLSPALKNGDYILLKKYFYGLRLPLMNGYIYQWRKPKRGEIALIKLPQYPGRSFSSRVVGLPNERVSLDLANKILLINGKQAEYYFTLHSIIGDQKVFEYQLKDNEYLLFPDALTTDVLATPFLVTSDQFYGRIDYIIYNFDTTARAGGMDYNSRHNPFKTFNEAASE